MIQNVHLTIGHSYVPLVGWLQQGSPSTENTARFVEVLLNTFWLKKVDQKVSVNREDV